MSKPDIHALKVKLVQACQILAQEGQGDYIWGHVTLRLPDRPDHLLMKPARIGLEEIGPDDVITVNLEGEKVDGSAPRHIEVFIHSEVMRVRPEVNCVVHTHPIHAIAFSSLDKPLLPVGHAGSLFCDGLPVYDETTDLITDRTLGASMARKLDRHDALLLRNHGIVTAGLSVDEAIIKAIFLENACKTQLLAESCGGPKLVTPLAEARIKSKRIIGGGQTEACFAYLTRRLDSAGS
jgi:ribulose-5-phosphate 4-epimerase/fuculose-1-phosphate aldolase